MKIEDVLHLSNIELIDWLLTLAEDSVDDRFDFWCGLGILCATMAQAERKEYAELWNCAYLNEDSRNRAMELLKSLKTNILLS